MNVEQARFNMIEQQIRPWEVLDQEVLDLLFAVKREEFVPPAYRPLAFADLEIPLGHGATMLAPKIEARMLQELQVRPGDKVLEIGAGSGHMAALLAAKAEHVHSLEIEPALAQMARENLHRQGFENVTVVEGDGARGWAAHAPYDVIVLSGSTPVLPPAFLQQLRAGGRLVAIVGDLPVMEMRLIVHNGEGAFESISILETATAPLKNALQASRFTF
ncbi:MAG: protein-L-isoaspartate O-methyltransferase [Rhodocyclaceae bacterium]